MSAPNSTAIDADTLMRRDGYMRPKEAARQLGCSERWLLDGLNKHGFPHTRMGRTKWLSREDLTEIRKLCRVPAEPAKIARLRRSAAKPKTPARAAA
jgi:excisionase family DNA binding protein